MATIFTRCFSSFCSKKAVLRYNSHIVIIHPLKGHNSIVVNMFRVAVPFLKLIFQAFCVSSSFCMKTILNEVILGQLKAKCESASTHLSTHEHACKPEEEP